MAGDLDDYSTLCLAVGTLMLEFAKLENAVSAGLRLHLTFRLKRREDTDPLNIAAAVYGSMRLRTSTGIMRRLMAHEGASAQTLKTFDALFAHVGHINNLRDKLAHQSLSLADHPEPGLWEVSDLLTTRANDRLLAYEFKTSDVIDAYLDLRSAYEVQSDFLPHPGLIPGGDPVLPTWRYKPSALKLVRQKSDRAPQ